MRHYITFSGYARTEALAVESFDADTSAPIYIDTHQRTVRVGPKDYALAPGRITVRTVAAGIAWDNGGVTSWMPEEIQADADVLAALAGGN